MGKLRKGGTSSPGNSPGTFFPTEILWHDGVILFELGTTQATSDFINTGRLDGFGTDYVSTFVDQGMAIASLPPARFFAAIPET